MMIDILSRLKDRHDPHRVIARDSSQTLTAEAVVARSSWLATELGDRNIRVMALHGDNSVNWLLADIACQLASICLVPIPAFFSTGQIQHIFKTVPVDAVITESPDLFSDLLDDRIQHIAATSIDRYHLLSLFPAHGDYQLPPATGKISFTSGSTGRPKGVCLSNQQLMQQAQALANAVGLQKPRHLCLLPLSTLLENVGGLYAPLLADGELCIPGLSEWGSESSSGLDPVAFTSAIGHYRPDSIILTPHLLRMLVAATDSGWKPPSSLQFVVVGGGRIARDLLLFAHQAGIPAYEGYGLSECASLVTLNTAGNCKAETCGRPLPHMTIEIEQGEIVISGNPMLGYVGEPDSWGLKRVYTGDMGTLDGEGFLQIQGRKINLFISSYGRTINPEWIECELLSRAQIAECVVFGDARPFCVALLSPRSHKVSTESLQNSIDITNARLPDYARIKNWRRLPRSLSTQKDLFTENGRPKRTAIATRYAHLIASMYSSQTFEAHERF